MYGGGLSLLDWLDCLLRGFFEELADNLSAFNEADELRLDRWAADLLDLPRCPLSASLVLKKKFMSSLSVSDSKSYKMYEKCIVEVRAEETGHLMGFDYVRGFVREDPDWVGISNNHYGDWMSTPALLMYRPS